MVVLVVAVNRSSPVHPNRWYSNPVCPGLDCNDIPHKLVKEAHLLRFIICGGTRLHYSVLKEG